MISEKILHLCKLRRLTLRAACQASGLKYSTLHAQISNDRPIPFLTIDKLARTLNVPLSYFSDHQPIFQFEPENPDKQSEMMVTLERSINEHTRKLAAKGHHISIDDVLDWLVHDDFKLANADWIRDRIDLFHKRTQDHSFPVPSHIGKHSLSAQFLGLNTELNYQEHLTRIDPKLIEKINADHGAIEPQKYTVSDQAIDVTVNGARVRGSYRRLLAGVSNEAGEKFILVFCRLIRFSNS